MLGLLVGDGLLTHKEMRDGFAAHIPELDQGNFEHLANHFDKTGSGVVNFDELCKVIEAYKQSKETPETPSTAPTQTDGEVLVKLYSGFDSVVYRVTLFTPQNATPESQDADMTIRLVGNYVQSPELRLPRISPTRTDFVIGQTARRPHVNFLPGMELHNNTHPHNCVMNTLHRSPHRTALHAGSTENFWFRLLGVGSVDSVTLDLKAAEAFDQTKFVMPQIYVQEYCRKDAARGWQSVVPADASGSRSETGVNVASLPQHVPLELVANLKIVIRTADLDIAGKQKFPLTSELLPRNVNCCPLQASLTRLQYHCLC